MGRNLIENRFDGSKYIHMLLVKYFRGNYNFVILIFYISTKLLGAMNDGRKRISC